MSWEAPLSPCGPVTNYTVTATPVINGQANPASALSSQTPHEGLFITELLPSTPYVISVTATNAFGVSQPATAQAKTLAQSGICRFPPGPVRGLTAVVASSTALQLAWSSPLVTSNTCGINYYAVTVQLVGPGISSGPTQYKATSDGILITGLPPGATFIISVASINSNGASIATTIQASTQGCPPAPIDYLNAWASSPTTVQLQWPYPTVYTVNPACAVSYFSVEVQRVTFFGPVQLLTTVTTYQVPPSAFSQTTNFVTVYGLLPSSYYRFTVTPINTFGQAAGAQAEAATPAQRCTYPPMAPIDLQVGGWAAQCINVLGLHLGET